MKTYKKTNTPKPHTKQQLKTKPKIKSILTSIFLIMLCIYIPLSNLMPKYSAEQGTTHQSLTTYSVALSPVTAPSITTPEVDFPVYSEGAILMESSTGKILYAKDENKKLYPASTTKILTAILAIENCNPAEKITASKAAVMSIPSGHSNAAIQPEEALTTQELLELFLIQSANEVGYIFAEHISGSIENFAALMNQKAASLGCKNTHFTNPSGIHDKEHYTTAYDMALIAQYCMKNETFRNIVSKTSCTVEPTDKYEKRYFKNTNELLLPKSKYYYEYAIGIKTGFTTPAKNCLIAASLKDNMELITVALGAEAAADGRSGRYVDTINLFNYGFENYKIQQIATANTEVTELTIENATKDTKNLQLLLKNNINGLTPANLNLNTLNPSVQLNENIVAPIAEGDVLGKITYNIDGTKYSSDLIASHSVEEFDLLGLLGQIALALFVLFLLVKLISPNKKRKKKQKSKNSRIKNSGAKKYKNKRSSDSIYKF